MKYNVIKLVIMICSLLGLIVNAASFLPIRDQAELREYALGQVTRGFRSISGDSLVNQGTPTWVETKGVGAEQVLDSLLATKLEYGLENPLDEVMGRIWLYDNENNLIFYGEARYTREVFEKANAGPQYALWMQEVPLLSGVVSAEILAIGEDGMTANRESLGVQNGHVLFRPYLAGIKNGLLSVRYNDDSVVVYDLSNPIGHSPTDVAEGNSMAWKISGHHVIPTSPGLVLEVRIVEVWEDPTALIEVKPGQTVSVSVAGIVQEGGGIYLEYPTSMIYTQIDGLSSGTIGLANTTISLSPGKYRLRFKGWKNFAQPGKLYTGPTETIEVIDGKG